jgi:nicotinamide phosphoribosyltransferase
MMKINPLNCIDFYKSGHLVQYPEGTELIYSNFTPRSSRLFNGKSNEIVFAGLQGFCKWFLIDLWNEGFFNQPKEQVVKGYKRRMDNSLGPDAVSMTHIEALHDLGYLPLKIKALPEGARVPMKVPVLTIVNTHPEFFWLVNYLESVMSAELWKTCTNATIAAEYKDLLVKYAKETGSPVEFCDLQGHDFSFRGMSGVFDAASSGFGHLISFAGTDSVPAIDYAEEYYGANVEKELIGVSVPATEHSVTCLSIFDIEAELSLTGSYNGVSIDEYERMLVTN